MKKHTMINLDERKVPHGLKPAKGADARRTSNGLDAIRPDTAGIDVGSTEMWVAVPEGLGCPSVRRFGAFTEDLRAMSAWLKGIGIKHIAMESTGVYWIPPFEMLQSDGFEVVLVNARHVKCVPGRPKTDKHDSQWLRRLHACGLLNPSFRPSEKVCRLRAVKRCGENFVRDAATQVQRMQKSLHQMNIQLDKVISDITGATGRRIIEAVIAGERDLGRLADKRDPQVKASRETIMKALEGNYRAEHVFSLRLAHEAYQFNTAKALECDREAASILEDMANKLAASTAIDEQPLPERPVSSLSENKRQAPPDTATKAWLRQLLGVDLTAVPGIGVDTALRLVAELGTDFSKWPTASHFASYLGLCPDLRISNSLVKGHKTRKVPTRVPRALRLAAQSLHHSGTALGAFLRRMKSKLGGRKAVTAAAHKLAVIIYKMVTTGKEFVELGGDYYDRLHRSRAVKSLRRRAQAMGFELVEKAA